MKIVLKKILFIAFLSGFIGLDLFAANSDDVVASSLVDQDVQQDENKEDKVKAFVDKYIRKFFITDSKLSTAIRCMMPFLVVWVNGAGLYNMLFHIPKCADSSTNKSFSYFSVSLMLAMANALAVEFYLSEVNRESIEK